MGRHPANLALRFFLEIAAFIAIGYWGWTAHEGLLRYLLVVGLSLLAVFAWGAFRVPNDGGPPLVRVPGLMRLLLEAVVFGSATWGLFDAGAITAGWIFGGITLIHYVISYDRIIWIVKQ
jgi:hypothetical protein